MSVVRVLLIDNFDSFTFNLVYELEACDAEVSVWRNDLAAERAMSLALEMAPPRLLVLSPGPGTPTEAGCCGELVRAAEDRIPTLGVCLGHQAIVEAFGGQVGYAGEVVHGKSARVDHDGEGPFDGIPSPMSAARYHSLAAIRTPPSLRVRARAGEQVMAVEHVRAPILGLQFHPESVLTPHGGDLMRAIVRWARDWHLQNPRPAEP